MSDPNPQNLEHARAILRQALNGDPDGAVVTIATALAKAEAEVLAVLEAMPQSSVVRVHEGGGPEDVYASLAVSVLKLAGCVEQTEAKHRERAFKDAIAAVEQQRAKYCVYSRDKQPASFCDCKFMVQDTGSENTGCAEMRMAVAAIQILAGIEPTIGSWLIKEIKADFDSAAATQKGSA